MQQAAQRGERVLTERRRTPQEAADRCVRPRSRGGGAGFALARAQVREEAHSRERRRLQQAAVVARPVACGGGGGGDEAAVGGAGEAASGDGDESVVDACRGGKQRGKWVGKAEMATTLRCQCTKAGEGEGKDKAGALRRGNTARG